MSRGEDREILAINADRAMGARAVPCHRLTRKEQADSLLELAEQLQGILIPVAPSADFRRRLHGELFLESQRRRLEPAPNLFQQHRKGILIGAAAVGSAASVVGVVVAFLFRLRHGRASHTAAG
jgi:hypothetical protein